MDLINGEFEFRGLQFGSTRSGIPLRESGFSVGPMAFRDQDTENSLGNGRVFGRDSLEGSIYAFDLWVIEEESAAGWQAASRRMSTFRNAWHGSTSPGIPRAVDELRLWHGDRAGRVYGRARNYAEDRAHLRRGYGGINCDFAAVDDLIYEDVISTEVVRLIDSSAGGIQAPLTAPLTSAGTASSRPGFFDVGGDAPAPVIIRINGPISWPRLEILGQWSVCIAANLAAGEYVEIDSRTWMKTILSSGDASYGGCLTRDSASLAEMILPVGTREVTFSGIDPTNSSTATISWRAARRSV